MFKTLLKVNSSRRGRTLSSLIQERNTTGLANCTEVPSGNQFNEERQGHKHMEYNNVLSQCTPQTKKGRRGLSIFAIVFLNVWLNISKILKMFG